MCVTSCVSIVAHNIQGNAMVSDVEVSEPISRARRSTDISQEYKEAGANHVLTKPVQEKRLKTMLVLANERRKLQGPLFSPSIR